MANSGEHKKEDLWDVQVSIARAAARLPKPSLAKLHYEVLEEIGQPPGLELVDYFVSLTDVAEEEVEEYFRFIGKTKNGRGQDKRDPKQQLADRIAEGDGPTVLKFRQAFEQEFKEPPPEELTRYFLQRVQGAPRGAARKSGDQQALFTALAEKVARSSQPTVLNFRDAFNKQFGLSPSDEITQYFLKRIQENSQAGKLPDEEFESKANFAETVANGLVSTVLQFRQSFEKAYGEEPSTEIIEVFIQNLPRKK